MLSPMDTSTLHTKTGVKEEEIASIFKNPED